VKREAKGKTELKVEEEQGWRRVNGKGIFKDGPARHDVWLILSRIGNQSGSHGLKRARQDGDRD
jgi:hypothetical protein